MQSDVQQRWIPKRMQKVDEQNVQVAQKEESQEEKISQEIEIAKKS